MKIEIDTNKDAYDMWKKIQKLIESDYCQQAQALISKPGRKEEGASLSRAGIKKE